MSYRIVWVCVAVLGLAVGACVPADRDPVAGIERARHRYAQAAAMRWHYLEAGAGEAVVLLHGMPESAWAWRYLIAPLAENFHVIAPDLKGFGLSDKPEGDYSFAAIADGVVELLSSIGVERFRLIGHDWGALIGARLASDHRRRIIAYAHLSAPLDRLDLTRWPDYRDFYYDPDSVAGFLRSPDVFVQRLLERSMYQGLDAVPEEVLERHARELGRSGVSIAVGWYFRDMELGEDWTLGASMRADWSSMDFPVLIAFGARDYLVPLELFLDAERRVPGLRRLAVIEDSGHYPAEEQPERTLALLREFFSEP